jgi:hypothetical protein
MTVQSGRVQNDMPLMWWLAILGFLLLSKKQNGQRKSLVMKTIGYWRIKKWASCDFHFGLVGPWPLMNPKKFKMTHHAKERKLRFSDDVIDL